MVRHAKIQPGVTVLRAPVPATEQGLRLLERGLPSEDGDKAIVGREDRRAFDPRHGRVRPSGLLHRKELLAHLRRMRARDKVGLSLRRDQNPAFNGDDADDPMRQGHAVRPRVRLVRLGEHQILAGAHDKEAVTHVGQVVR